MFTAVKIPKHKLIPFEHAQSMFKWLAGLVYIGIIFNYLPYLPTYFPGGLKVDLEGSSTFPILMLLIHINRLGLFNHLYRYFFYTVLPHGRVV